VWLLWQTRACCCGVRSEGAEAAASGSSGSDISPEALTAARAVGHAATVRAIPTEAQRFQRSQSGTPSTNPISNSPPIHVRTIDRRVSRDCHSGFGPPSTQTGNTTFAWHPADARGCLAEINVTLGGRQKRRERLSQALF
jgi:hypothetical protein